jgi:uncharacterized protein
MTRLELLRRRFALNREIAMAQAATASIVTHYASRYLQQLCKHWAHKLEVAFDPQHGTIRFPGGTVATLDADDEGLTARIEAPDDDTLERMKQVVTEHLDRFAFREAPLHWNWRVA